MENIQILFLVSILCRFIKGARIDHAHHDNTARKALEETISMEQAVIKALELTNQDETLIIVTGDHSHVFTVGGYPYRGNDILGKKYQFAIFIPENVHFLNDVVKYSHSKRTGPSVQ